MMTMDAQQINVQGFLRISAHMAEQNRHQCGGYTSLFHFIHKNGRPMRRALGPTKEMVMWTTPKECFRNAAMIALRPKNRRFIYCEGYAMGIVPTAHAWLIDDAGQTFDPTWSTGGEEYFGIAINRSYLLNVIRASDHYGVIDQPELGFPILKAHVREWRHPVMDKLEAAQ